METNTQASWTPEAGPDATAARERPLEIRFTGSGSEYFRIWVVNLLLSIVTLSLYRPWAKLRRLRYFYANTMIDGHALDFHGNPWKMLRGYLLVGAMLVCYSVAGRFSPTAALVALLILAVLWPALLRASMQFRLANTSWRGLRFRFSGNLGGAYAALLPMFVPALALAVMGLGVTDRQHPPSWYLKDFGLVMLATVLVMPLVWWNFKRYQHDHFGLGQWHTKLTTGAGSVYLLCLKVIGVTLLSFLVVFIALSVGGGVLWVTAWGGRSPEWAHNKALVSALTLFLGLVFYFFALMVPMPYATSRAQNLIWSHTRSDAVSFRSNLAFGALLKLTLKNWLLMVVTLGLYYPFATAASYRLRVESITPQLSGDLDQLQAQAAGGVSDASGDAAGDLFGIDIGL